MACTIEFIEFVCTQLAEAGEVHSRKMFGDYMIQKLFGFYFEFR